MAEQLAAPENDPIALRLIRRLFGLQQDEKVLRMVPERMYEVGEPAVRVVVGGEEVGVLVVAGWDGEARRRARVAWEQDAGGERGGEGSAHRSSCSQRRGHAAARCGR